MIKMPEATTIANQMKKTMTNKTIRRFTRGNLTHKFLWLNRSNEEFEESCPGLVVTGASRYGRSIYLYLGDHMLWWGDTGGKLLYHEPGESHPKKYHLGWDFSDGSCLSFTMRMWGSVKLLDKGEFIDIPHEETGIPPLHPDFTFENFDQMLDTYPDKTSKGIKGFLVATGYVTSNHLSGLGNVIVQDILFNARLSPKRKIPAIQPDERRGLYNSIQNTIGEAINKGGRYDEFDLFGEKGGYVRLMDSKTAGTPCPKCDTGIEKISYPGGACYLCPSCQN
jgi:formamidopyrimidine-DNA glycosylase